MITISLKYLRHRLLAGHRNGYGIHSPFVYDLVRNVVFDKNRWDVPGRLREYHHKTRNADGSLQVHDLGAGSRLRGSLGEVTASRLRGGKGEVTADRLRGSGKKETGKGKKEIGRGQKETGDGNVETSRGQDGTVRGKELVGNGKQVTENGKGLIAGTERKISSIARRSSVTRRQGALLYRLAKWYRPAAVIEAGTGLGISTSYLAAGAGHAGVTTIEGSPPKFRFAQSHTDVAGSGGLEFLLGSFDAYFDVLVENAPNRTLFFIDGDHRYVPTMQRISSILDKEELSETMVILDDIYWSDEMERAWKASCVLPGVDISLDLFHMGILIRRPGISRHHFRINF